jgi:NAD(P)-dependent dehydrogenase (short-subunit alcohol dehydrogenase family)
MFQTVVITGAGSGLGRAFARLYAGRGARVACADLHPERAIETVAMLDGGGHLALQVDVGDDASVEAMAAAVHQAFGAVDLLINNAGVATGGGVVESAPEDWPWVININTLGVVRGCRAFVPRMRARGRGHVLNIASFAALAGAPEIASYAVSKAGVVIVSEGLRGELYGSGVGVSVACPAFFPTRLLEDFRCPGEQNRRLATRLMQASSETAESIAQALAAGVERGRFLLIPTRRERMLWRLRRWLPEFYFRRLMRMIARYRKPQP